MRPKGGSQTIPRPPAWRLGPPPGWAALAPESRQVDVATVVAAVRRRGPGKRVALDLPGTRRSAVLVALFDGPHGAEVVLTRRARHLRSHKGEVSFPGGRADPGETPEETARREAWEEVHLDPRAVTVEGELDHVHTVVSRSLIVPVVATLPGKPVLTRATEEVDRVLTVPLSVLALPEVGREERWGIPPLDRPVHFFELHDETVWGATGRMLWQLLAVAFDVEGT